MLWSHNDCNLNNIILRNNGSLLLLDYEFSATNYAGFDLGNFFNEYTTNYEANSFEINSER